MFFIQSKRERLKVQRALLVARALGTGMKKFMARELFLHPWAGVSFLVSHHSSSHFAEVQTLHNHPQCLSKRLLQYCKEIDYCIIVQYSIDE